MNLLHRYLFRSVLAASMGSVFLFVALLLAGNAIKELLGLVSSGQVSWVLLAELVALLIPYVFSFALPIGVLTGILIVFGKLSAQREIIAVKSAGISVWSMSAPVFAVALLGTAAAFFINNFYGPGARGQYKRVLANVLRDDPMRFITPRTFIDDFSGRVFYIGGKEGNEVRNVWIWELDEEHRATYFVQADSGRIEYDAEADALKMTLTDATGERRDSADPDDLQAVNMMASIGNLPLSLPLKSVFGSRADSTKLSNMSMPQLLKTKSGIRRALHALPPEAPPQQREKLKGQLRRAQIVLQKNTAMAFSVLSLTVVGIPIAIRIRRRELYANGALAFALAIAYYFAMMVVSWLENQPAIRPDLLVWTPNIVFQSAGFFMLYRANHT